MLGVIEKQGALLCQLEVILLTVFELSPAALSPATETAAGKNILLLPSES